MSEEKWYIDEHMLQREYRIRGHDEIEQKNKRTCKAPGVEKSSALIRPVRF